MPDEEPSYETLDEAIAVALSELEPGGVLSIHAEGCALSEDDDAECTCEPLEMVTGAQA